MRLRIFFCVVLLLGSAAAQFTTVSGTVTDPNSLPYANGTITATLVSSASPKFTASNLPYSAPTQPVGLNSAGSFVMQLADNTLLTPGGSTWSFTVSCATGCVPPVFGKGPISFTVTGVTISGASQSITATLTAAAPALTAVVGGGGTGTVSSGTATQLAFYSAGGTTVSSNPRLTDNGTVLAYTGAGGINAGSGGIQTTGTVTGGTGNFTGTVAGNIFQWNANAPALQFFGNCTGSPATPSMCPIPATALPTNMALVGTNTSNTISKFTNTGLPGTIGNSALTDNGTVLSYSGTGGFNPGSGGISTAGAVTGASATYTGVVTGGSFSWTGNVAAHQFFGNNTGVSGPPAIVTIGLGDLPTSVPSTAAGTSNFFPKYTATGLPSTLGNSLLSDTGTTLTYSGSSGLSLTGGGAGSITLTGCAAGTFVKADGTGCASGTANLSSPGPIGNVTPATSLAVSGTSTFSGVSGSVLINYLLQGQDVIVGPSGVLLPTVGVIHVNAFSAGTDLWDKTRLAVANTAFGNRIIVDLQGVQVASAATAQTLSAAMGANPRGGQIVFSNAAVFQDGPANNCGGSTVACYTDLTGQAAIGTPAITVPSAWEVVGLSRGQTNNTNTNSFGTSFSPCTGTNTPVTGCTTSVPIRQLAISSTTVAAGTTAQLSRVYVTGAGNGAYTSTCTVSGGGASVQATCTAVLSAGNVVAISLGCVPGNCGGVGYTSLPTITVASGSGETFTPVMTGGVLMTVNAAGLVTSGAVSSVNAYQGEPVAIVGSSVSSESNMYEVNTTCTGSGTGNGPNAASCATATSIILTVPMFTAACASSCGNLVFGTSQFGLQPGTSTYTQCTGGACPSFGQGFSHLGFNGQNVVGWNLIENKYGQEQTYIDHILANNFNFYAVGLWGQSQNSGPYFNLELYLSGTNCDYHSVGYINGSAGIGGVAQALEDRGLTGWTINANSSGGVYAACNNKPRQAMLIDRTNTRITDGHSEYTTNGVVIGNNYSVFSVQVSNLEAGVPSSNNRFVEAPVLISGNTASTDFHLDAIQRFGAFSLYTILDDATPVPGGGSQSICPDSFTAVYFEDTGASNGLVSRITSCTYLANIQQGGMTFTRLTIPETASYTILGVDSGVLFTNTGAAGAITFTLPSCGTTSRGFHYLFEVDAAQTMTINAATNQRIKINGSVGALTTSIASAISGARTALTCIGTSTADVQPEWEATDMWPVSSWGAQEFDTVAQTANLGSTPLVGSGQIKALSTWSVSWYLENTVTCTTPGPATVTPQVLFTDGTAAKTIPVSAAIPLGAANSGLGGVFTLQAVAATGINLNTTGYATCTTGTATYKLHARAVQLSD